MLELGFIAFHFRYDIYVMEKKDGNMTKTNMKVTLGMGGIYTASIYQSDGVVSKVATYSLHAGQFSMLSLLSADFLSKLTSLCNLAVVAAFTTITQLKKIIK